MADHHDAVAGRHAAHGDEADDGGDADVVDEPPGQRETAHERERDVQHDLQGQRQAAEVAEEQNGHREQHEDEVKGDALRRGLLRLEFAFKTEEIAFRQTHLLTHGAFPLVHEAFEITHPSVGRDDDAPLGVLAVDDIRPLAFADVRDEPQGNALATISLDEQLADLFRRITPAFRQAQHQIDRALALAQFRDGFAAEQRRDLFIECSRLPPVCDGALTVYFNLNLRDRHLRLQVHIGQSGDCFGDVPHLLAFFP